MMVKWTRKGEVASPLSTALELLPGWRMARLGDVCSLRAETVQPTDNPDASYVGLEHLDSGNPFLIRWGIASKVTSSKSRFYAGDVLYGKLRPYLDKGVLAEFDGICSTDILVFKSSESMTSQFLVYLVHTHEFLEYAIKTTCGVNHPRTSWSSLAAFEFACPPPSKQYAIAHALRIVQEAQAARRREAALEHERKAALMQYLFTHGTRNEPRRQTEIGEVPESWGMKKLSQVARIERGKFAHRPRNAPEFYGGKVPFIQTGDVTNSDGHIRTYTQTLNERGVAISKVFPKGTILITIAANIGYTAILEFDCAATDSLIGITPFAEMDNEFLNYYLSTQQPKMDRIAPRGTQKNINIEFLVPWPIVVPDMLDQRDIAEILHACDAKIAALEREAQILDELFRVMLEELMTGRLSVGEAISSLV